MTYVNGTGEDRMKDGYVVPRPRVTDPVGKALRAIFAPENHPVPPEWQPTLAALDRAR